jgi:hypothetical protein
MSISRETLDEINKVVSKDVEFIERRKISNLDMGKVYIIKKMVSLVTRFGKTILVTLLDESENITFNTFLPKRVAETLTENLVDVMNGSDGKYTLTYLGQSKQVFAGNNTRALVSFGCVE